ncbi:hypothetical protein K491DRAFT_696256 [Lophiostoma macrostomum CBS 122681]|uniref:Uncharacterized protein n=1 Tax=Lophiostoma macrostomum CBS 122681 TaxID=1314788 RepID=A0A6A6SVN7_9PLEO|nr:hypothetical protein K491DRAFT_696256 [Lophiostoma macrostomum CBS 122681]
MGGVTALTFINPCDKGAGNCQMHRSYGQDYASARLGEGFAHFDDVPLDTSQSMARLFSITLQAAQTTVADIHCIDYGMEHVSYYGFYDEEYPHESSAWDFPIDFPKWSLHNGLQNSSFSNLAVLKMHLGCSSYVYDKDSQDRFVYHFSKFLSGTSLLHTLSFTMVEEWDGKDLLTKLTASPVTATVRNFAMINFALTSTHLISVLDNLPTALRTLVLESTCGISRLGLGGIPWIRDTFTELRMIRVQSRCNCGCSYAGIFYDGNEMTEYLNEQIRELISESDEDLY